VPEPIRKIPVEEKSGRKDYVGVRDVRGLVMLVQMGVLEIHAWGSRQDRLEQPDRLIFDLDPGEGVEWREVVDAARLVREQLAQLDLESFVRSTGGHGLHVVAPLVRKLEWPSVKQFASALARRIAHERSDRYLAVATRAKRKGKIYIDYLRNDRGATAIASYSPRAREGAPVAVPLGWDELDAFQPGQYDIRNVPDRLEKLRSDPWKRLFSLRQSLTKSKLAAVGIR
jgi:bifunctional non-homologous end joining protein LigD